MATYVPGSMVPKSVHGYALIIVSPTSQQRGFQREGETIACMCMLNQAKVSNRVATLSTCVCVCTHPKVSDHEVHIVSYGTFVYNPMQLPMF